MHLPVYVVFLQRLKLDVLPFAVERCLNANADSQRHALFRSHRSGNSNVWSVASGSRSRSLSCTATSVATIGASAVSRDIPMLGDEGRVQKSSSDSAAECMAYICNAEC